jgi:Na+/H+ antiporter NhaD/arsenite permease-like protein
MIGSAVGLSFNDFLINLTPIVLLLIPLTLIPVYLIWGRSMHASEERRQRVMAYQEKDAIRDERLLKQSLSVLGLVIGGFVFAHPLHLQPATIAMFGAAVLLLLHNFTRSAKDQSAQIHHTFTEVEWTTIFFFIGLFILVHGIDVTGLLQLLANKVLALTGGDISITSISILWLSAIASAVVDNIPFVATMIPLIKSMAGTIGDGQSLMPLWWSLALGSCLGGNGSLIGASANVIVAGFAERAGEPIRFMPFLLIAFPMMIYTMLVSMVYVYLRYL